jgi:glycosyltransferase involved in cell wall biosynthesis
VADKPTSITVSAATRALMLTPDEGYLDRRIVQEAASLAKRGWQVHILAAVDAALRYSGPLHDGVRLLVHGTPARSAGARNRALRALRRRVAPRLRRLDRAIEAARYRRTDRAAAIAEANVDHLLAGSPYDLVFAHDVPVFSLGIRLADAWDVPLICDLHEIFPEQDEHFTTETARAYWRSIEAGGIARADGVICVNSAVADYVASRYAPTAHVVIIHNSMPHVEPAALVGSTIRDYYQIPRERRVMLFAGSLRPHANLETVIAGFGRANLDNWVLAILGAGPLEGDLKRGVKRAGLEGRIYLGARAPESELLQATSSADIGLLPYQAVGINHEIATPNKLFEYMQARLPIATSRLPMIEQIITGSGIGGFVDYSSAMSTADGLNDFVATTLPTVGRGALDAAAMRWSWEREEPALDEVVDAAIARRR